MRLLNRWRKVSPSGVYALYEDRGRVGPLPIIYSHYHHGYHVWEVLVPAENAERMNGMHIDLLPSRTQVVGTLSAGINPYQWHPDDC
jgi:hypothetical protein